MKVIDLKKANRSEARKNRHETWIKECIEEKQKLLEVIERVDRDIVDYRMRRRSELNRITCKSLSPNYFIKIITNEETRNRKKGLYWIKENGVFVGMDNTSGDAWVEEFNTLQECINWLLEEED